MRHLCGLDLPVVTLEAERGDVTVHLSCALHRSTHPESAEHRVIYTGFALPPRPGDRNEVGEHGRLLSERAAIAGRQEQASVSLACVAAAAVDEPIRQHVYAALASGDIAREEFEEFVLHVAYYAGWPRASALEMAYYQALADLEDADPNSSTTTDHAV